MTPTCLIVFYAIHSNSILQMQIGRGEISEAKGGREESKARLNGKNSTRRRREEEK